MWALSVSGVSPPLRKLNVVNGRIGSLKRGRVGMGKGHRGLAGEVQSIVSAQ